MQSLDGAKIGPVSAMIHFLRACFGEQGTQHGGRAPLYKKPLYSHVSMKGIPFSKTQLLCFLQLVYSSHVYKIYLTWIS